MTDDKTHPADRLSARLRTAEELIKRRGFTASAHIELPSGAILSYAKHNKGWGLYLMRENDEGYVPAHSAGSILERVETADALEELLRELELAQEEQTGRIAAAIDTAERFIVRLSKEVPPIPEDREMSSEPLRMGEIPEFEEDDPSTGICNGCGVSETASPLFECNSCDNDYCEKCLGDHFGCR